MKSLIILPPQEKSVVTLNVIFFSSLLPLWEEGNHKGTKDAGFYGRGISEIVRSSRFRPWMKDNVDRAY